MTVKKRCFILIPVLLIVAFINSHTAHAQNKNQTPGTFNTYRVPGTCADTAAIDKLIADAISLGAPIYNAGLHIGCYRIYEWAAYKILYVYGNNCKDVEKILKPAIEKSHGDFSDTEKAWIMRAAFDKILGEPTKMVNPEKEPPLNG